jgi:hypothetical protein
MPASPRLLGQRSTTFNPGGNVAFPQLRDQRRFTPGNFNRSNTVTRFQNNRNFGTTQGNRINRFANNNRGFNRIGTGNHVFARRSADWHRDWNRHSDHWWNGHRCRFVNGSWLIFDFGFVPWYGWSYYDPYPYDYYYPYSYGPYGYDPGVYDQSAYYDQGGPNNYNGQPDYYDQEGPNNYNGQPNNYDQGNSKSFNQGAHALGSSEQSAANVADVQDQLARAGYYRGKIDGVLGPETRHALVRYQSAKGLHMTGSLTTETQQSLGLAAQGAENSDPFGC